MGLFIWLGALVLGPAFLYWEIRMAYRSGYLGKRK